MPSAPWSESRGHCLQAIEELNIKPRFWKDLLTDEPFTRKDIIHLQDPLNLQVRDLFGTERNSRRLCKG